MARLKELTCWLILISLILISMHSGAVEVGLPAMLDLLTYWSQGKELPKELSTAATILIDIRLPRLLTAALTGVALSAAGVLTQGLFRNPLASPSILGMTSGASLGAALVYFLSNTVISWYAVPFGAFAGGLATMALVLAIAVGVQFAALEQLLLVGFALSAFLGSLTTFVVMLAMEQHQHYQALSYWLLGGLAGASWDHLWLGFLPVLVGILLAWRLVRPLNLLVLGEEVAQTLLESLSRLKVFILLAVALLVAGSVTMAGAISFVGLVVPHLTRLIFGPRLDRLLIYSAINGMSLMLAADSVARVLRAPLEMPVGIVLALVGAPTFLFLLARDLKQRSGA